jgi:hypothetical protein
LNSAPCPLDLLLFSRRLRCQEAIASLASSGIRSRISSGIGNRGCRWAEGQARGLNHPRSELRRRAVSPPVGHPYNQKPIQISFLPMAGESPWQHLPMPPGGAPVGLPTRDAQERLPEKNGGVQPHLGLIRQTQPAKIELGDQHAGADCLTLGSGEYKDESGDRKNCDRTDRSRYVRYRSCQRAIGHMRPVTAAWCCRCCRS